MADPGSPVDGTGANLTEEDIPALQDEIQFLREQLEGSVAFADLQAEQERAQQLQVQLEELHTRFDTLADDRDGADADITAANARVQDLETKLSDSRRDNDLFKSQLEQRDAEMARMNSDLRAAQARLSAATAEATRASQAGRANSRELTQHARENVQLKDEMRGLVEEITVQRAAVADLQTLLQTKAEVMAELEARLEEETQAQREASASKDETEDAYRELARLKAAEHAAAKAREADLSAELEDAITAGEAARERARTAQAEAARLTEELRRIKSQTR